MTMIAINDGVAPATMAAMPVRSILVKYISAAALVTLVLAILLSPISTYGQAPTMTDGPLPAPKVAPKAMTNDSVLRMVKAALGDDLIVQTIATQPGQYTTDADSLVELKQAGTSDRVIAAMVNKSRIRLKGTESPVVLSDVNEIGVYYKDRDGKWQVIEPEIVHIK